MLGLALSGGAAKGLAHLRVWDILTKEYDLKIDMISGASAGALFGSMLAMGKSTDEIRGIISSAKFQKMIKGKFKYLNWKSLLPFGSWTPGLFRLTKFRDYLNDEIFHGATFDDLPIQFVCAYTDLENNKTEYCNTGLLADAVTFSISFPIVFESMNGRYYDGGLKINCPSTILKTNGMDHIIAIDLTSITNPDFTFRDGFIAFINRVFDVLWTETFIDDLKCADVVIAPKLDMIHFFDFDKYDIIKTEVDHVMNTKSIKTKLEKLKSSL